MLTLFHELCTYVTTLTAYHRMKATYQQSPPIVLVMVSVPMYTDLVILVMAEVSHSQKSSLGVGEY